MASNELVVDDEYCKKMGEFVNSQGEFLDECLSNYLTILNRVASEAIVQGETNKALTAYISKGTQMKGKIKDLSSSVKRIVNEFVTKIDEEDKYLF